MSKTMEEPAVVKEVRAVEIGIIAGILTIVLGGAGYLVYHQLTDAQTAEAVIPPVAAPTPAVAIPVVAEAPHAAVTPDRLHAEVQFDFGQSRLRADAIDTLKQPAEVALKEGRWAVLIEGFTDRHGPAGYNKALALKRGESVKQFLTDLGVPKDSMKVIGLGGEAVLCEDATLECQRLNRRVHVEFVKLPAITTSPVIAPVEETIDAAASTDASAAPIETPAPAESSEAMPAPTVTP